MEYNLNEQLNKMKKLMGVMPINESLLDEKMSNDDIYTKYYSKIPKEDFEAIVNADPSKKKDGSIGKFTKWMLSLYQKESLQLEDLYKATEYLTLYMKHFNHVEKKDINMFKSLGDLYKEIEKFKENADDYKSNSERDNEIKKDAEKVYEDSEWLVVVPKTKEASCYYGKGTQWCTAASENDYMHNKFDYYNSQGTLYINIDKKNKRKYQFHFKEQQFMDEKDMSIESPVSKTIGMSEGLLNYYKKQLGDLALFILNTDDNNFKLITYKSERGGELTLTFLRDYKYDEVIINKELLLSNFFFSNGNKVTESENFKIVSDKNRDIVVIYNNFIYQIDNYSTLIIRGMALPEKYKTEEIKDIKFFFNRTLPKDYRKIGINNDLYMVDPSEDDNPFLVDTYYNNGITIGGGNVLDNNNRILYKFPLGAKSKEELEQMDINFFSNYRYNIGTQAYEGENMIKNSMWLDDVFTITNGAIYADGKDYNAIMTYPIKYNTLEDIKNIPFYRDNKTNSLVINGVTYDKSKWDLHNKR